MKPDLTNALAGFELYGKRYPNNTIKLPNGQFIDDWPNKIEWCGNTYTKENIVRGSVNPLTGAVYENVVYV